MNVPATTHPSDDVLRAFLLGKLPPREAAAWERHLADCAECLARMECAETDTFCDLLRDAQQATRPDNGSGASAPPQPPTWPEQLRSYSRYQVHRLLGVGGMGMVFHATHRLMNRPVALKVIRPEWLATPLAIERFRREVRVAASLSHPNIVTAFDAEEYQGIHLLVMEYVDGLTLEQLVAARGALSVPLACAIARQVARGLEHAHARGMIHRDIKPQNVMLTRQGKIKILDFGLARLLNSEGAAPRPSLTQSETTLGTYLYAAPEQWRSAAEAGPEADVYSLGATLLYLLTGRTLELRLPPGQATVLSLEGLPATVPPALAAVLERALAEDPRQRPISAAAFAQALTPWATPPRAVGPRMPSRRTLLLAAGGVGLLALLGVAGWMLSGGKATPSPTPRPVVFILSTAGLWYEDFEPARNELQRRGVSVQVATWQRQPARLHPRSAVGLAARPESVPAEVDLARLAERDWAALVFVGFEVDELATPERPEGAAVRRCLDRAEQESRWLVGICYGQWVLGRHGLLRGRSVARLGPLIGDLPQTGARPQQDRIVREGRLLTATGPEDASEVASRLATLLLQSP